MRHSSKEKIIAAALVVFAKNPLATMEQVAEGAGIGRATLFRHFSGKKALMRELVLTANARCMAALIPYSRDEGPAMARLEGAISALIPEGAAFHFLTYEPWHSDDQTLEQDYQLYLSEWAVLLKEVQEQGGIDGSLPLYWLVTTLDVLLYGAWEAIDSGEIAPRQAAALTIRTFLRGVGC